MKIGFLDYQLTNSHYKKFYSLLTGSVGAGDIVIVAADELESTDQGKQWCAANNVRYCETAQEVVEASDAIIVLAPNNTEKHLEVAGPALASGKPVYIDKLLAKSLDHARAILDAAAKAKTPVMCASSLRFAVELDQLDQNRTGEIETLFARGYGNFQTYAVHTIAMMLRYFGPDVQRVIDTGTETARMLTLDNGKTRATIEVRDAKNGKEVMPWQLGILSGGKYEVVTVKDTEGFYTNLMKKAVEFFKTGVSPVSNAEMLAAVAIESAAQTSLEKGGVWVELTGIEKR